jgi:hypothetical protein
MIDCADAPGFWRNETSGVLRPAVEAYLKGEPLSLNQIAAMRAYLRQWMRKGDWRGERIEDLREAVERIRRRRDIDVWLQLAAAEGIDPL